jgi:hypothetical protein
VSDDRSISLEVEVTMRGRRIPLSVLLLVIALAACARPLPPAVAVTDIRTVTGTYSGSTKEYGYTPRPTQLVINPDNTFEIATGGPEGTRITGVVAVAPDGTLGYQTGTSRGRGVVYEGDGRRVIIFNNEAGSVTSRVERSLP